MAGLKAHANGITRGAVNQGSHNQVITLRGSFDGGVGGCEPNYPYEFLRLGDGATLVGNTFYNVISGKSGSVTNDPSSTFDWVVNGSGSGSYVFLGHSPYTNGFICDADTTYSYTAYVEDSCSGSNESGAVYFKTDPVDVTASTPTSANVTAHTADISCQFYPNTNESTATVWLEYKKQSDSTWTQAGATGNYSGYSQQTITRSISGLTASTVYVFRLQVTRNTTSSTSFTSGTGTFTTAADVPAVTTNAATVVTSTSANLNGHVQINGQTGNAFFIYGTDPALLSGTTQTANIPETADADFSQAISGLTASTTYYFKAGYSYSGGGSTVYGSILSFTTAADPLAASLLEDHMTCQEFNERKYGVQSDFYFTVSSPSATSSDRFFNAAVPFVAGDVKISKDGGALANVTNLPTRVGTSAIFKITITATEMQGDTIVVQFVDQDGPAYRDGILVIRTLKELGKEVVDATQYGGNVPGVSYTGVGTSPGLLATGGATSSGDITGVPTSHILRKSVLTGGAGSSATLDAGASATNDYYTGDILMLISGTGAGQSRVITAYDGTTKIATVNSAWSVQPAASTVAIIVPGTRVWDLSPSAELASIPTATANYGLKVQMLFQRFTFKITQTATVQSWFKSDSSTTLGTRSVSDDGTTQLLGKIA